MFLNNVYTFKNLPVQEKQRKWTDCCMTIVTALFALTMFILSFVFFHKQNFFQVNYPVNDNGKTCGYENKQHPIIYFEDVSDLSKGRYCVKSCPSQGQSISCSQAKQCAGVISLYDSSHSYSRLGLFCVPQDANLAKKMWEAPQLQTKHSLLNAFDVILISLGIGVCIGVIFLLLVICLPYCMTYTVFLLSGLALITAGVLVFVIPLTLLNPNWLNIVFGVLLIIIGIIYLMYICCFKSQLELIAIFMKYGNIFLKQSPMVYLYIPLFLLLTAGLLTLILWQYIAYGTYAKPTLETGHIYKKSQQNVLLQVLNLIELLWGLQFLRDSFNFVVSGNAVEWYFKYSNNYSSYCCRPFSRLLCKNWGSVAGGSFLNAFLSPFDFLSDCFRCDPKGSCGKCANCYKSFYCCDYIFQLVRTDAYSFINLSGIPYCNSARQCQALCTHSELFRGTQSCIRLYRIAAHFLLVVIISVVSYFLLNSRTVYMNTYVMCIIIFMAYVSITYFIDIHANAAQGIMICYLTEENCDPDIMNTCPPELVHEIYHYRMKYQSK